MVIAWTRLTCISTASCCKSIYELLTKGGVSTEHLDSFHFQQKLQGFIPRKEVLGAISFSPLQDRCKRCRQEAATSSGVCEHCLHEEPRELLDRFVISLPEDVNNAVAVHSAYLTDAWIAFRKIEGCGREWVRDNYIFVWGRTKHARFSGHNKWATAYRDPFHVYLGTPDVHDQCVLKLNPGSDRKTSYGWHTNPKGRHPDASDANCVKFLSC